MAHQVYSVSVEASVYNKLKSRAEKNESSVMRELTLIMRSAAFSKAVKKEKTWVKAVESCVGSK